MKYALLMLAGAIIGIGSFVAGQHLHPAPSHPRELLENVGPNDLVYFNPKTNVYHSAHCKFYDGKVMVGLLLRDIGSRKPCALCLPELARRASAAGSARAGLANTSNSSN